MGELGPEGTDKFLWAAANRATPAKSRMFSRFLLLLRMFLLLGGAIAAIPSLRAFAAKQTTVTTLTIWAKARKFQRSRSALADPTGPAPNKALTGPPLDSTDSTRPRTDSTGSRGTNKAVDGRKLDRSQLTR